MGKEGKSQKKKRHPHVFINTVKSKIKLNSLQTFADFPLSSLLAPITQAGTQIVMDRNFKLVSIGVQIMPEDTGSSNYTVDTSIQLQFTGPFSGTSGVPIAAKPPKVISKVNPTYLKITPTGAFQKQPFNSLDDQNRLRMEISTSEDLECEAVITTKAQLLPQKKFPNVIPIVS